MRLAILLCVLSIALPAWAGTLSDNFDDGDFIGWQMAECLWIPKVVTLNVGNWVVEEGAAVGGDNDQDKLYELYIGDMSWADYTAEVSVKLSKRLETCNGGSGVWLGVRFQLDEGKLALNDYYVGIWNSHGTARQDGGKYMNGDFLDIQTIAIPSETGIWYKLKIEAEGDQITGFVDDLKVVGLRDISFKSGAVCIGVNGVEAMFDNVKIKGPDIPDIELGHSVDVFGKLTTTWAHLKR